ncbi:MAG: hypothetical protein HQL13_05150, partial [Candidatus Omnitrophica bacterium]|nr:hypothetical protein [Candidatus Omnitrophota bacterium]
MIKKCVIWGVFIIFLVSFVQPVLADQSLGFKHYFSEGVKALEKHDAQEALRCFTLAQIYDPDDKELQRYLDLLKHSSKETSSSVKLSPEQSIGYKYYYSEGLKAFHEYDNQKARRYFSIALIYYPDSLEAARYLKILENGENVRPPQVEEVLPKPQENVKPVSTPMKAVVSTQKSVMQEAIPESKTTSTPLVSVSTPEKATTQPQSPESTEVALATVAPPVQTAASIVPVPAVVAPPAVYVPVRKAKQAIHVLSLDALTHHHQMRPRIQIELNSAVIIEGSNIQNFLEVDEHYFKSRLIDANHLEIDAVAVGPGFIHIWDKEGRHTIYIEVVLPPIIQTFAMQATNVIHSQPFVFNYANDWNTYYTGKDLHVIKRQSYGFSQTLSLRGETPYGFFDASGSYSDFNGYSQFDSYTVGLSQIPLEGTSNFNIRAFDSLRYLSPLTMPSTQLRGG